MSNITKSLMKSLMKALTMIFKRLFKRHVIKKFFSLKSISAFLQWCSRNRWLVGAFILLVTAAVLGWIWRADIMELIKGTP